MIHLKMQELLEKKLVLQVWFKNLTSGSVMDENVHMSSFYINGCFLVMPSKHCVKGHQILLRLLIEDGSKPKHSQKQQIEVTGNVVELTSVDEKFSEVNVQFSQYIKEEWHNLIGQFETRQEEINILLKKLRSLHE